MLQKKQRFTHSKLVWHVRSILTWLQKNSSNCYQHAKIGGMLSLSPMVDVIRNPYFNRLEESYGEDAYLSAAMGSAFVEGLQDGGMKSGVAACSKHFWAMVADAIPIGEKNFLKKYSCLTKQ